MACFYFSKEAFESTKKALEAISKGKGKLKDKAKKALEGITREEIETALGILKNDGRIDVNFKDPEKHTLGSLSDRLDEDNLKTNISKVIDCVLNERKEGKKIYQAKTIENSKVSFYENDAPGKNAPQLHPDTIYIYTSNLEDEDSNRQVVANSAKLRNNTDGKRYENTLPLILRRRAYNNTTNKYIGKNATEEEKRDSLLDNNQFKKQVDSFISSIKQKLQETDDEGNPKYVKVILPIDFTENIGFSRESAEYLQKALLDELGIITIMSPSNNFLKDTFTIKVDMDKTANSNRSSNSKSKNKENKSKKEEAIQSLLAERPDVSVEQVENENILMRMFPNIADRKARIHTVSMLFTSFIKFEMESLRKVYNEAPVELLGIEDLLIKNGLNSEDTSQQYKAAFSCKDTNGRTFLQNVKQTLDDFISQYSVPDTLHIPTELIETFINEVYDTNSPVDFYFTNEYREELKDKGSVSIEVLKNRAIRIITLLSDLNNNKRLYSAILDKVSEEIEKNENVRLSFELGEAFDSAKTIEENEEEDEGNINVKSEVELIKYKLIDPIDTVTARIKRLLSSCYQVDNKGRTKYNDFGTRIPIQYEAVYRKLVEKFSAMNSSKDFERVMPMVEEDYPWFKPVAEKLRADTDLRNEFYRCMRNTRTIFGEVSSNGRIAFKNYGLTESVLIDNMTQNYEGHVILSDLSIYDTEGKLNTSNIEKLESLFQKKGKNQEVGPLKYALNYLDTPSKATAKELKETWEILTKGKKWKGLNESSVTLFNIVSALGINAEDFSFNMLLPDMTEEDWQSLDRLNEVWTLDARHKLSRILHNIEQIIKYCNKSQQAHIVWSNKKAIRNLAEWLTPLSEAYTQNSFWDGKGERGTYAKPDKISEFINIVGNTKTNEDFDLGTQYLDDVFLKYDFLKNMPLLRELRENKDLRESLFKVDILKVRLSDKPEIARVNELIYIKSCLSAYYAASNMGKEGSPVAYYVNPLYSDAEALQYFRLPKEKGANFKEAILDKLTTVALSELDRIIFYKNQEKGSPNIEIEHFNDSRMNSTKFCLIKGLNEKNIYNEILSAASSRKLGTNYVERETQLKSVLKKHISTILETEFNKFFSRYSKEELAILLKDLKDVTKEDIIEENLEGEIDENKVAALRETEDTKSESDSAKSSLSDKEFIEINSLMEQFFYNDYYMQSQLAVIFAGDPAQYKDNRDYIKRLKQQAYSAGERVYGLDEQGNPLKKRVLYIEDKNRVVSTFGQLEDLFSKNDSMNSFEKEFILGTLRGYADVKESDGMGIVSLNYVKKLFIAMGGKWNNEMEEHFNELKNGNLTLQGWTAIMQQIKPLLSSYEDKQITITSTSESRREKVMTQHKDSQYLITALYDVLNTAFNHSPEWRAMQHLMEIHDIDGIEFHSSVKIGYYSPVNLNYAQKKFETEHPKTSYDSWYSELKKQLLAGEITAEQFENEVQQYDYARGNEAEKQDNSLRVLLEKGMSTAALQKYLKTHPDSALANLEMQFRRGDESNMVKEFLFDDIMLLQPAEDHFKDQQGLKGSQFKNIIIADLPEVDEEGNPIIYTIHINGEEIGLTKKQLVEYYDCLVAYEIADSYEELYDKFSDKKSLREFLNDQMARNPKYNDDIKAAVNTEYKSENGNVNENILFGVPFNSPILRNKMSDLLLSSFKNNIQRQKIKGGNVVLVTSFGNLDENFKIQYEGKGKNKRVKYIPCLLPASSKDILKDYLIETPEGYYTLDFKLMEENMDDDLLYLLGYRIPTEQKYSMFPLKVVGFMPESAGSSIMLPAEAVAMSGFDFDIDKLFLMMKEWYREKFDAQLGVNFMDWAIDNQKEVTNDLIERVVKVIEDEKTGKKRYKKRRNGFTGQELVALSNNPIFKEYLDSLPEFPVAKYHSYKPTLIYDEEGSIDIIATAQMKQEPNKNKRWMLRNNMLIDLFRDILTSKEGSRLMMSSATYVHLKSGSRQHRVMDNPEVLMAMLKDYKDKIREAGNIFEFMDHFAYYTTGDRNKDNADSNIKALEDFYSKYSKNGDTLSITSRAESFKNLMEGNGLIGVYAVNSSRHYKLQFANVTIKDDYAFSMIIPGYNNDKPTLINKVNPMMSPFTHALTTFILAENQAASPDNGKDPCLGDNNMTMDTKGVTNFLLSLGIPNAPVGWFLKMSDSLLTNAYNAKNLFRDEEYENILRDSNNWVVDLGKSSNIYTKLKMGEPLTIEENKTSIYFSQWWFYKVLSMANAYNKTSVFIRADSPNGALGVQPYEVIKKLEAIEEFKSLLNSREFPFEGMENLINLDLDASKFVDIDGFNKDEFYEEIKKVELPRLQAFYSCGIIGANSLVQDMLPELSPTFIKAFRTFKNIVIAAKKRRRQPAILTDSELKTFINEFTTYLLSSVPDFHTDNNTMEDRRNYYIHDFPMKFAEFKNRKNSNGEYVYEDIRNLPLIQMLEASSKGIKITNIGGKTSSNIRTYYTETLDAMQSYESDNKEREEEVNSMAKDLFMYSYYENGFIYGDSNFGTMFSTHFTSHIEGYNEEVQKGNERVINNDTRFVEWYIMQHLLNHPELIPAVHTSGSNVILDNDGNLHFRLNSNTRNFIKFTDVLNGSESVFPLVRTVKGNGKNTRTKVYALTERRDAEIIYSEVSYNTTDMPFYDNDAEYTTIRFDKLKDRGSVFTNIINGKSNKKNSKEVRREVAESESKIEVPRKGADMEERQNPGSRNLVMDEVPEGYVNVEDMFNYTTTTSLNIREDDGKVLKGFDVAESNTLKDIEETENNEERVCSKN